MNPAPLERDTVLSPAWLDAVLGSRFPGTRVAGTQVVEELATVAVKIRFRVDYEANPAGAPEGFCVKGYFAPDHDQFAAGGLVEAGFYAEAAPHLKLRVPPCVHAGIDPETRHGLILMEDLVAGGCTFLTAMSPYSVDQTAATLEQLALLHSADSSTLRARGAREASFLAPRLDQTLGYVPEEQLQNQLDDGRAQGLPSGLRSAARLRAGVGALGERSAADARTLVHGDAHAGNLYVDPAGAPGLIDWQVVQWGSWAIDVAYHIGAVLDTRDREESERALLRHYLAARGSHGDPPPADEEAWDAYRQALVYGYFMWAITRRVERPIVVTFTQRLGQAVAAHESLERLKV